MRLDTSHASLHFPDSNRVTEVLEMKDLKIAGKKIYPVVAHKSLMNNLPDVSICPFSLLFPIAFSLLNNYCLLNAAGQRGI